MDQKYKVHFHFLGACYKSTLLILLSSRQSSLSENPIQSSLLLSLSMIQNNFHFLPEWWKVYFHFLWAWYKVYINFLLVRFKTLSLYLMVNWSNYMHHHNCHNILHRWRHILSPSCHHMFINIWIICIIFHVHLHLCFFTKLTILPQRCFIHVD